jgi:hypothetical protein
MVVLFVCRRQNLTLPAYGLVARSRLMARPVCSSELIRTNDVRISSKNVLSYSEKDYV